MPEDSARMMLRAIAGNFDVESRNPFRPWLGRLTCRIMAEVFRSEAGRVIKR